jgi:hypothetical protein
MDTGIASVGNFALKRSALSLTILDVAFESDNEKNCHGKSPVNKNKK